MKLSGAFGGCDPILMRSNSHSGFFNNSYLSMRSTHHQLELLLEFRWRNIAAETFSNQKRVNLIDKLSNGVNFMFDQRRLRQRVCLVDADTVASTRWMATVAYLGRRLLHSLHQLSMRWEFLNDVCQGGGGVPPTRWMTWERVQMDSWIRSASFG